MDNDMEYAPVAKKKNKRNLKPEIKGPWRNK